jgi:tripartite-type tricarboxylate transporter receptor subunit TctC
VPFPAGGYADSIARAIAPSLERSFHQTVIVTNKGGAGGAIGSAFVANAVPDGHTALLTLSSLATLPEQAVVNNQRPPFSLAQLRPLARLTVDPMAFIVRKESPLANLGQLLTDAQARPGELTYGSSGNYGAVHVPVEMFLREKQLKVRHIPYSGGAPLMLALLSGEIDFTLVPRSLLSGHVRSGKVRILATLGSEPWTGYGELPTTSSVGLRLDYQYWSGVFAPAGTSPRAIDAWRSALRIAVDDSIFKSALSKMDSRVTYLDAPQFDTLFKSESIQVAQTVRMMGKLE